MINNYMNEYFVYVYAYPSDNGKFTYGKRELPYVPFYIGKGKADRHLDHLKPWDIKSDRNFHKKYTIRKILKNGKSPVVEKLYEGLSHKNACRLETSLIKLIGRVDKNKGPLLNLTDGGEGSYGRICSTQTREKMSKSTQGRIAWNKGLTKDTDQRVSKYANKMKNKPRSNESKIKQSKSRKKLYKEQPEKFQYLQKQNNHMWKVDDDVIISLVEQNKTMPELVQELPLSQSAIYRRVKELNLVIKKTPIALARVEAQNICKESFIKLYNSGATYDEIKKELNISGKTIARKAKSYKLKPRKRPINNKEKLKIEIQKGTPRGEVCDNYNVSISTYYRIKREGENE